MVVIFFFFDILSVHQAASTLLLRLIYSWCIGALLLLSWCLAFVVDYPFVLPFRITVLVLALITLPVPRAFRLLPIDFSTGLRLQL